MDRRRPNGARQRRDHHAGRQQDRPERQATGLHRRGRAKGQRTQRHVHRNVREGRLQRQAVV